MREHHTYVLTVSDRLTQDSSLVEHWLLNQDRSSAGPVPPSPSRGWEWERAAGRSALVGHTVGS